MEGSKRIASLLVLGTVLSVGCAPPKKVAEEPIDWTNRVCESPIYKQMIGTYEGVFSRQVENLRCRWDVSVVINGDNNARDCDLKGSLESVLIETPGSQAVAVDSAVCSSGLTDLTLVNGLNVSDDLDSIRPVSIIFHFLPVQTEKDDKGRSLVHPITQYQSLTVDTENLASNYGSLRRVGANSPIELQAGKN